ncbi:MAG: hypothetical protein ACYC9L_14150 [Sulfuricaulis sp.]
MSSRKRVTRRTLSQSVMTAVVGETVTMIVLEVTDISRPEDGSRDVRKAMGKNHLAMASARGQSLKLADLLDNTPSIVKYDPAFAKVYLREKTALLEVLTLGSPRLYAMAAEMLRVSSALLLA